MASMQTSAPLPPVAALMASTACLMNGSLAVGSVEETITDDALSACFGLALTVSHNDGRWAARAR